ncbi:oocyte zinc finger protein XlCOF6-like isoform X1 [Patiria miniata]|uniref:C2H2-type domain-containing protein n=1 Tax=Patiria miniata TaxID=46514 RepID=A0A913ZTT5_PATMI|nr:oocyte zinc finger protein XlCOF6-like isoform X1 [Patiria miniata]
MEPGQEVVEDSVTAVEQTVDPSSIAYTVEIHLVDEGYANQNAVVEQQLTVEGDGEMQGQPIPTAVVIADGSEGMSEQHQTMTTEPMDSNVMVTFSESDPPANLHHLTVSSDMMTYLPESSVPQSENTARQQHHQIIMTQHQTSEGITEVKLVDSIPDESGQDMPVLLVQPQAENSKPAEDVADSQQGGETIKEMETQIASAVEALEALTGLATTFNAWAQQNPQVLDESSGHSVTDKPHKSAKHKSGKHKSKKHKSGKHKKKSSYKKEKSSIDIEIDESSAVGGMWKCKTCAKIFPSKLKLKNHMISHSDERPHVCDVCGSAFKRARYLQIHKKSHFSDTQFACQYCSKAYFEKKRLRSHMKCHLNPLNCEICGKSYGDKRGLQIHLRTHTNEKPYVCRLCGRGFTSKAGVNKHERSHSGLKPYVCKTCGKAYTQPTNLSDHERTHINERTFACTSCRKVFLARSSLRRHRIKNHPGVDPNVGKLEPLHQRQRFIKRVNSAKDEKSHYKYTCAVCSKKFKKEKYLKKHSKTHTVGTKACSYCSKSFRDKRDLLNHERRHTGEKPYKCSNCGKAFVSSSAMLRHEKCHLGLRPYICTTCGKGFTRTTGLRDHELIHKGKNKRFACDNCDKIFASRSALRSHGRLKHQHDQFAEVVDAPLATVEVPVETEEGEAVSYIKLMFTEA